MAELEESVGNVQNSSAPESASTAAAFLVTLRQSHSQAGYASSASATGSDLSLK